jgi:hypothetical protein
VRALFLCRKWKMCHHRREKLLCRLLPPCHLSWFDLPKPLFLLSQSRRPNGFRLLRFRQRHRGPRSHRLLQHHR